MLAERGSCFPRRGEGSEGRKKLGSWWNGQGVAWSLSASVSFVFLRPFAGHFPCSFPFPLS